MRSQAPSEEPADLRRLPHLPPALLLTSGSLDRKKGLARGIRDADSDDPLCRPTGFLPQALLVEILNQTAGLLLPDETRLAMVAGLRGIRLHRAARIGERIQAEARLERRMGELYLFKCRAVASGELLAEGTVTLRAL